MGALANSIKYLFQSTLARRREHNTSKNMGRKTYNERIKRALERGRDDIADEVRLERVTAYLADLNKLLREYGRQLRDGELALACATLHVIIEAASKQREGLQNDHTLS